MTLTSRLAWDDSVLPFQLDHADVRGRVARLDTLLARVLAQHAYPPAVESLVAEAVMLAALIGPTIKLRWKLSLQVRCDGPVRIVAVDYHAPEAEGEPARLRAWASFDAARIDARPPFEQLGTGYFAMLLDQGDGTQPYQGITPLAGQSLADCAEAYFAQSEQLPTRFALALGRTRLQGGPEHWRAGGVMLQHLPPATGPDGAPPATPEGDAEAAENWTRVNLHLSTVEELELLGPRVQPTELLVRLFHEEEPRVFAAQGLRFGCSCSAERVRESLSIYSARDIATMTTAEGLVTADCQFCGAHYEFDPATLGFEAAAPHAPRAGAARAEAAPPAPPARP